MNHWFIECARLRVVYHIISAEGSREDVQTPAEIEHESGLIKKNTSFANKKPNRKLLPRQQTINTNSQKSPRNKRNIHIKDHPSPLSNSTPGQDYESLVEEVKKLRKVPFENLNLWWSDTTICSFPAH